MLSCVVFDNSTNADTTGWFNDNYGTAVPDNMISNTRDGDVVTSVLTIKSVSLNDNGYFCFPSFGVNSYIGMISVAGNYEHLVCNHVKNSVCLFLYIQYIQYHSFLT